MVNRFLKPLFYWQQGNGTENAWIEKQTLWTDYYGNEEKKKKIRQVIFSQRIIHSPSR